MVVHVLPARLETDKSLGGWISPLR